MNTRLPITAALVLLLLSSTSARSADSIEKSAIANLTRGLCMSCHSISGENETIAPAFSQILKVYRLTDKATPTTIAEAIATYTKNPQKAKGRLPKNYRDAQMTAIQLPNEQLIAIAKYLQALIPPEEG